MSFYENLVVIVIIVGWNLGFVCKYSIVIFIIFKSLFLIFVFGICRCLLEMFFSDRVVLGEEDKVEINFFGCFFFIILSIKILKLYILFFFVIFIV